MYVTMCGRCCSLQSKCLHYTVRARVPKADLSSTGDVSSRTAATGNAAIALPVGCALLSYIFFIVCFLLVIATTIWVGAINPILQIRKIK